MLLSVIVVLSVEGKEIVNVSCVWVCIKLASVIKTSDGKGGQSEGVIEVAAGAGLCSGFCFSSRATAAFGLTLKV